MAQSNTPSMAESKNTPLDTAFATPLTVNDLEHDYEDPEEWEYEYSTTETETYYVTLDLTTPDVKPQSRRSHNGGIRSTKAKWLNPGMERTEPKRHWIKPNPQEGTQTPTESQTPRPHEDIDDDAQAGPDDGASHEDGNGDAAKVQIMSLHSSNPIVSYRGHVYSCEWASNIGTELLFTEHDPDSPLPILRNLPGNVDLLAASLCRIISRSLILEEKAQTKVLPSKSKIGQKKSGKDRSLRIPVGNQASEKRKGQARFLERLMEIKAAKGEEDDVTVYAQKKLSRTGWKTYLDKQRKEERSRMLKIVRAGGSKGDVEVAKQRLEELDKEEVRLKEVEKKGVGVGLPQGAGRKRAEGGALDVGEPRKKARVETGPGMPYGESESTPTPWGWGGGEEEEGLDGDMDEDMMQDDENMEEEILYDEETYGDEDAPEEDEEGNYR